MKKNMKNVKPTHEEKCSKVKVPLAFLKALFGEPIEVTPEEFEKIKADNQWRQIDYD